MPTGRRTATPGRMKSSTILQIHVTADRVRLYTMTGVDWTDRYPRVVAAAVRLKHWAILDAEAVYPGSDGIADFEALYSRMHDEDVVAYSFDLLMLDGTDLPQVQGCT